MFQQFYDQLICQLTKKKQNYKFKKNEKPTKGTHLDLKC